VCLYIDASDAAITVPRLSVMLAAENSGMAFASRSSEEFIAASSVGYSLSGP